MKLLQLLHDIVSAKAVLDSTDREWAWPAHVSVRVGPPDAGRSDETVLLVAELRTDRLDVEVQRLRAIPLETTVVLLVEPSPELLPVGAMVDLLVGGGIHALHALPLSEPLIGTAVVGRRSNGEAASIAPYLDPRRELGLTSGDAMLRIVAERVVEGVSRRMLEAAAARERQARSAAERERDEARAAVSTAQQQLAEFRSAQNQLAAETLAKLAAADARVQRILASKSYRLARALSAPARLLRLPFASR